MTTTKCDTPCGTCPWRAENQTPEAVRNSPRDGMGMRWFDPANLRQRWSEVADGGMMPCHATDSNAPLYGGKKPKGKPKERVCVGLTTLARREVTAFMVHGTDYAKYAGAEPAKASSRMTLLGLAAWASRLMYAGATLGVGRRVLKIPVVGDDPKVQFPWEAAP